MYFFGENNKTLCIKQKYLFHFMCQVKYFGQNISINLFIYFHNINILCAYKLTINKDFEKFYIIFNL